MLGTTGLLAVALGFAALPDGASGNDDAKAEVESNDPEPLAARAAAKPGGDPNSRTPAPERTRRSPRSPHPATAIRGTEPGSASAAVRGRPDASPRQPQPPTPTPKVEQPPPTPPTPTAPTVAEADDADGSPPVPPAEREELSPLQRRRREVIEFAEKRRVQGRNGLGSAIEDGFGRRVGHERFRGERETDLPLALSAVVDPQDGPPFATIRNERTGLAGAYQTGGRVSPGVWVVGVESGVVHLLDVRRREFEYLTFAEPKARPKKKRRRRRKRKRKKRSRRRK